MRDKKTQMKEKAEKKKKKKKGNTLQYKYVRERLAKKPEAAEEKILPDEKIFAPLLERQEPCYLGQ